jgi:hypothetical protein
MVSLSAHGFRSSNEPSRRGFLITMMGAGVMLGYARSSLAAEPAHSAGELFEPTIWYGIDPSGTVTINIIRAEMGQHVGTSLGRIVAEELEADWNKVKDRSSSTGSRRIPTWTPIGCYGWPTCRQSKSSFSSARKHRLGLVNPRLQRLRQRLEMRSSTPAGHASVICRSGPKPCWKRSRTGRDFTFGVS